MSSNSNPFFSPIKKYAKMVKGFDYGLKRSTKRAHTTEERLGTPQEVQDKLKLKKKVAGSGLKEGATAVNTGVSPSSGVVIDLLASSGGRENGGKGGKRERQKGHRQYKS